MAQRKLTAEQRRWRAEGDAECLAQARVIEQDAQRFNAARKIAQERADILKKEAQALQSVAQRKSK